ncbi:HAD family phosphatase [Streptomyces sp. NPDC029554]|uniref:HAD family hydrolase n=1 Tax=Streptomyces sp. NPDC029554 TaxID=3155126 RepID=UPI0033E7BDEC
MDAHNRTFHASQKACCDRMIPLQCTPLRDAIARGEHFNYSHFADCSDQLTILAHDPAPPWRFGNRRSIETRGEVHPMYKAALFDLDGTLVNSERKNREAWARLFRQHQVPYDDSVLRGFTGRPAQEAMADHVASFGGYSVDELCAEAAAYAALPEMPAAETVEGAMELLHQLHRLGVPLGVVTSGPRDYAEPALTTLGALRLLDVLVTADDVSRGKPDPEGYRAACSALKVEPSEAVVFEDAPAGILAAKRAGMFCVGLTTTHEAEALTEADVLIKNLAEVRWPTIGPRPVPDQGAARASAQSVM